MNEQVSLSYSRQPNGNASISFSIIPAKADGSLNTDAMICSNIFEPADGSPEAAFISAVNEVASVYRNVKGI